MDSDAMIAGATTCLGAAYAFRLAQRGYGLTLVARDRDKLEVLAQNLRADSGARIELLPADLTDIRECTYVADRLRRDSRISTLINLAGTGLGDAPEELLTMDVGRLIALNTTSMALLAHAAATRFACQAQTQSSGSIVNVGAFAGVRPGMIREICDATAHFVLFMSQRLAAGLAPRGGYVQAVLPADDRLDRWQQVCAELSQCRLMPEAVQSVDAALVDFDARFAVTIAKLPDLLPLDDGAVSPGAAVARADVATAKPSQPFMN